MLQTILRNRFLFISSVAAIWFLIFLIPRIGDYYRLEINLKSLIATKEKERKQNPLKDALASNNRQTTNEEDEPVKYHFAGEYRQGDNCLDTLDAKRGSKPGLFKCHGEGRNQFWFLLKDSLNIRNNDLCLEGPKDLKSAGSVLMQTCSLSSNQSWLYENERFQLSGSTLCLETNAQKLAFLEQCSDKDSQKWIIKTPPGM